MKNEIEKTLKDIFGDCLIIECNRGIYNLFITDGTHSPVNIKFMEGKILECKQLTLTQPESLTIDFKKINIKLPDNPN